MNSSVALHNIIKKQLNFLFGKIDFPFELVHRRWTRSTDDWQWTKNHQKDQIRQVFKINLPDKCISDFFPLILEIFFPIHIYTCIVNLENYFFFDFVGKFTSPSSISQNSNNNILVLFQQWSMVLFRYQAIQDLPVQRKNR